MGKRVASLLCALTLLFSLTAPAFAQEVVVTVSVDGAVAEMAHPVLFEGTTYVSLYHTALALRPDASGGWDDDFGGMIVSAEDVQISAKPDQLYLLANGRYLYIPQGVQMVEGDLLVPVRTLAKALGAQVDWDGNVLITSGEAPIASGERFYDATDLDLLARVIYHESGYQPFSGQLAVGNVILNRVASPSFPDTVSDVVYQSGQFPGATSKEPDEEAIIAAKLCLDGAVVLDDAYWFNGAGKPCWASRNKALISVIGGHAFYG